MRPERRPVRRNDRVLSFSASSFLRTAMNDLARAKASFDRAMSLLRVGDAASAERICVEALADFPEDANLLTLLGASYRKLQRLDEAEAVLRRVLERHPGYAKAHEELGTVLLIARRPSEARASLERALSLDGRLQSASLKLSSALAELGETEAARCALDSTLQRDPALKALAEAAELFSAGRLEDAEKAFRRVLARHPGHVDALRGLANVAKRMLHQRDAAALLRRTVELAPDFAAAWDELGTVLIELDEYDEAVASIRRAVQLEPGSVSHQLNLGSALARAGQHMAAIEAYERARSLDPERPGILLALGNALKTVGRHEDAIAAFRRAIELRPEIAEAYWSLSNLKTFNFTAQEIAAMEEVLARPDLPAEPLVQLSFALGQAYESLGDYDRAFGHFQRGNSERRAREHYDPVQTELVNDRIVAMFTEEFLATHAGSGDPDPAPIFIVGLPRSGSTLIEQILASHSMIEGTQELPSLGRVIQRINRGRRDGLSYPEALREATPQTWADLGRRYLDHTRRYRRGAPHFIDKMPNNFPSVGLLHLIVPNARVIDARRRPLDTCVSCYKQLFAQGQSFTYDLMELGEYYLQYLRMMEHWDRVLPGRVLRVQYEDVVADLEEQARRLIEFCGLGWEGRLSAFPREPRAVRTASSEQVRRPIYGDSVGSWHRYAPHLEVLVTTLGRVAEPEYACGVLGGDAPSTDRTFTQ
jgi:tetratricopeptide (TPR) repeat protein